MTLAELSAAWDALRNKVLGRSVAPIDQHLSPELLARVGSEYEAWRQWYLAAGSLEDLAGSLGAQEWVSRYNVLAAEIQAEGLATAPLDTVIESVKKGAAAAGKAFEISGEVVLLGFLAYVILTHKAR